MIIICCHYLILKSVHVYVHNINLNSHLTFYPTYFFTMQLVTYSLLAIMYVYQVKYRKRKRERERKTSIRQNVQCKNEIRYFIFSYNNIELSRNIYDRLSAMINNLAILLTIDVDQFILDRYYWVKPYALLLYLQLYYVNIIFN